MKTHDLKTIRANYETVQYFYTREKNDINGNPRFRVFVIDQETATVHEIIFKCYESQIADRVRASIEEV
mgnify:CR=1 FL=1